MVDPRRAFAAARVTRGTLGTAADLLTLVTVLGAGAGLVLGEPLPQAVMATFLCALCAALLALLLQGEMRYGRRVRQSLAFPTFATAMTRLSQETHALLTGGSTGAFQRGVDAALQSLADAYSSATGPPCRLTVKIIYRPESEPDRQDVAVRTVCRAAPPAHGTRVGGIDWINDNSDFRQLLKEGTDHFFCNDLPAALATGYRNSHFTEEVIAHRRYPYLATIVWPVRGAAPDAPDEWDLIGFLCLDAPQADAFDPDVDVAPGAAFAHALYSGLLDYRNDSAATGAAGTAGGGTAS